MPDGRDIVPANIDEIIGSDGQPVNGWQDLLPAERMLPERPSYRLMLVIAMGRQLPVEVTEAWLLSVLPEGGPREQVEQAALVVVTDPDARLALVVKNEADAGEYLEMHTAAFG